MPTPETRQRPREVNVQIISDRHQELEKQAAERDAELTSLREDLQTISDRHQELEKQIAERDAELTSLREDLRHALLRAMEDPLTGLANRKTFDEALRSAVDAANNSEEGLSLIMIDIDHFKQVNDKHGHPIGDIVLQYVGRALSNKIQVGAVAARYGGEEFAIILPGARLQVALALANSFREALAEAAPLEQATNEILVQITVSIGVAQHQRGDSAQSLIRQADKALYTAKRDGRNCVRAWIHSGLAKMTKIRPELTLLRSSGDAALSRASPGEPGVSQSYPLLGPLGPVDSAPHRQHSAGDWRNRI